MEYIFRVSDAGGIHLMVRDSHGQVIRDIPRAVRLSEACRRLKRSRRHLYRTIAKGRLAPVAKFSGELFFDPDDLGKLERRHPRTRWQGLAKSLAPLFPEYDLQTLDAERDADLILARILERGNSKQIRWAVGRYPKARRRRFLSRHGRRLLSDRAFRFWAWLWGVVRLSRTPNWRKGGLSWGGAA